MNPRFEEQQTPPARATVHAPARVLHIQSRDNPHFKMLKRLLRGGSAFRKTGETGEVGKAMGADPIWIEGEHLCQALLRSDWLQNSAGEAAPEAGPAVAGDARATPAFAKLAPPVQWVLAQTLWQSPPAYWQKFWQKHGQAAGSWALAPWVLADALMQELSALGSGLPSAQGIAALLRRPKPPALQANAPTVVLDRLQDPGNVGSILRSAAALGFGQVLALRGTAALWSPKVLRAGMGAHFSLRLIEALSASDVAGLQVPLLFTSSHQGEVLHQADLPWPCAWVMGHEGQGIGWDLQTLPHRALSIAQPGGQESLNVAAAAAICLHASASSVHFQDSQAPVHVSAMK